MKRYLLYTLLGLITILVLGTVYFFRHPGKLIDRAIRSQIEKGQNEQLLLDTSSITLYTIGTGTPLPGDRLPSCNAVFVNGHFFIFDLGPGTVQGMENIPLPLAQLDAIFISHWHSDHFMDLPYAINRSWQLGRNTPLMVYGPSGLDSIMNGINAFLHLENSFRVAHHGPEVMPPAFSGAQTTSYKPSPKGGETIYQNDGIRIITFEVCHEPVRPSYGFRIEYKDKVLVLSGDTKKCDQVIKFAQDADILVHEVMATDLIKRAGSLQQEAGNQRIADIMLDITDYHTNPTEVAEVAKAANVKALIMNHIAPSPDNAILRQQFTKGLSSIYSGPITLAEDGDLFIID